MGSSLAILNRWLLVAVAACAAAYSAGAQGTSRRPGQAILFSSTDASDVSTNMPTLAAKPPGLLELANEVQSPGLKFDPASSAESLPAPPPPALSPAEVQRRQQLLDEGRNWALLTPAEIMGLSTPEKMLAVPDRDALGQPNYPSVVARFFDRQAQSRTRTNTDNYGAAEPASRWDLSGSQGLQRNQGYWKSLNGVPGNSSLLNQFMKGPPEKPGVSVQSQGSGWSKPLSQTEKPAGRTPEQEAAVAQFRQLLQPHSTSADAGKVPASGGGLFPLPSATPNPASAQMATMPAGTPYPPLSSGMAMPAMAPPFPGLFQTNQPLQTPPPEWRPPPPPWMSTAPQLGVIPQRKF